MTGAKFLARLPLVDAPAADEQPACHAAGAETRGWRRNETVLIVDDSTAVLEAMVSVIQALGYTTAKARNGKRSVEPLPRE